MAFIRCCSFLPYLITLPIERETVKDRAVGVYGNKNFEKVAKDYGPHENEEELMEGLM